MSRQRYKFDSNDIDGTKDRSCACEDDTSQMEYEILVAVVKWSIIEGELGIID